MLPDRGEPKSAKQHKFAGLNLRSLPFPISLSVDSIESTGIGCMPIKPAVMDAVEIVKHESPSELTSNAHGKESLRFGEAGKAVVSAKRVGNHVWDLTRRFNAYVGKAEIRRTDFQALRSRGTGSTPSHSAENPPTMTAGTSAPSVFQSSADTDPNAVNQGPENGQSDDTGNLNVASADELLEAIGAQFDADSVSNAYPYDLDHRPSISAWERLLQGYESPWTWAYGRLSDLVGRVKLGVVQTAGGSDASSPANTAVGTTGRAGQSTGHAVPRFNSGKQDHRERSGDDTGSTSTRPSRKQQKKVKDGKKKSKEKEKVYDVGDALIDILHKFVTCPLSDLESPRVWCADRRNLDAKTLKEHVKYYHSDLMSGAAWNRVFHQGSRLSLLNVYMRIESELFNAIDIKQEMNIEQNAAHAASMGAPRIHQSDVVYEHLKHEMMTVLHQDLNSLREKAQTFLQARKRQPASYAQMPAQVVDEALPFIQYDQTETASPVYRSAFFTDLPAGISTHHDSGYSTQSMYDYSMPGNEQEDASYCFNMLSPTAPSETRQEYFFL